LFCFSRQGVEVAGATNAAAQADHLDQVVAFEEGEMLPYTDCADVEFLAQFGGGHLSAVPQQMQDTLAR
jgi:hypothetical protein